MSSYADGRLMPTALTTVDTNYSYADINTLAQVCFSFPCSFSRHVVMHLACTATNCCIPVIDAINVLYNGSTTKSILVTITARHLRTIPPTARSLVVSVIIGSPQQLK